MAGGINYTSIFLDRIADSLYKYAL